jgi:hypothetical protein
MARTNLGFGRSGGGRSATPKRTMVFFALFMAVGLIFLIIMAAATIDAQRAQSWPSTEGTISSSMVKSEWSSSSSGGGSYLYYPDVHYHYSINGQSFNGNVISKMLSHSSDSSYAYAYVSDHPIGSQVTVYYNPLNPSEAVLDKDVGFTAFIGLSIGAVFVVIGAIGVFYFYRKSKSG